MEPSITVRIGGRAVTRGQVQAYESRRVDHVLAKLRVGDRAGTLPERKQRLLDRKLDLGHERLTKILTPEADIAGRVARTSATISRGRRRVSAIDLSSDAGDAAEFVAWFTQAREHERSMLTAHPEHYLNVTDDRGRYVVWETNGGSPFVARFQLDFEDTSTLRTPEDERHPHRVRGTAKDGATPIGGVSHQFRDEGSGFAAMLAVEYPLTIPPWIIAGHRWHLAVEWSNWTEAYLHP